VKSKLLFSYKKSRYDRFSTETLVRLFMFSQEKILENPDQPSRELREARNKGRGRPKGAIWSVSDWTLGPVDPYAAPPHLRLTGRSLRQQRYSPRTTLCDNQGRVRLPPEAAQGRRPARRCDVQGPPPAQARMIVLGTVALSRKTPAKEQ
jgi:hypothetical protein